MARNIFDLMEERLQSFSKGKRTIATYILENPNDAAFQTAALIGKAVGISESSVVRFAGDLGFKGFPDFQHALQQVAMERLRQKPIEELRGFHDRPVSRELLQAGVAELLHCRELYLLSHRVGSTLFPYCSLWGEELGKPLHFLTAEDPEPLFHGLSTIESGDLILCLMTGSSTDLLTFALEQGKRLGARLLLLTDTEEPAVESLCDILLSFPRGEEGPVADPGPCMTLLHRLFRQWACERTDLMSKQTQILEEIRYAYENRYL